MFLLLVVHEPFMLWICTLCNGFPPWTKKFVVYNLENCNGTDCSFVDTLTVVILTVNVWLSSALRSGSGASLLYVILKCKHGTLEYLRLEILTLNISPDTTNISRPTEKGNWQRFSERFCALLFQNLWVSLTSRDSRSNFWTLVISKTLLHRTLHWSCTTRWWRRSVPTWSRRFPSLLPADAPNHRRLASDPSSFLNHTTDPFYTTLSAKSKIGPLGRAHKFLAQPTFHNSSLWEV